MPEIPVELSQEEKDFIRGNVKGLSDSDKLKVSEAPKEVPTEETPAVKAANAKKAIEEVIDRDKAAVKVPEESVVPVNQVPAAPKVDPAKLPAAPTAAEVKQAEAPKEVPKVEPSKDAPIKLTAEQTTEVKDSIAKLKESMGTAFSAEFEDKFAEKLESPHFDKFIKAGYTAAQATYMCGLLAQGIAPTAEEKKLIKRTIKEVKDMSTLAPGTKGGNPTDAPPKRSSKEAMRAFKQSKDDADLTEAMGGVDDILDIIGYNKG